MPVFKKTLSQSGRALGKKKLKELPTASFEEKRKENNTA